MTGPLGSTLSTGGFLAVQKAGFRPLRQVQGTSVLSLGWQPKPAVALRGSLQPKIVGSGYSRYGAASNVYMPRGSETVQQYLNEGGWLELEQRTSAYNDARTQALTRLREAAHEAGALAVVDVRLRRGRFAQATGVLGIDVRRERDEQSDDNLMVTVDLLGNAVTPIEQGAPQELVYALRLSNG